MNANHVVETDVAIIGAGTAGMSAYRAALEHTPRVLVIESGVYGTTCARVGCMPSKLLKRGDVYSDPRGRRPKNAEILNESIT